MPEPSAQLELAAVEPTPAPEAPAPAPAPPAQEVAKADVPKAKEPGPAARKLAEIRARKEAKAAEREAAKAAAANVDPAIFAAAQRWQAHEKAESKRISAAAAGLDESDRALIDGEKDLGRKAMLLDRLQKAAGAPAPAAPAAPKAVAKPGPTGAPPSVTSVDFAEAIKTPEGLAAAKASDPEGFARKFSAMLRGTVRKSTLDVAAGR